VVFLVSFTFVNRSEIRPPKNPNKNRGKVRVDATGPKKRDVVLKLREKIKNLAFPKELR